MQNTADHEDQARFQHPSNRHAAWHDVLLLWIRPDQDAVKIVVFALAGLLLLLQYTLWFGTGGAVSLWELQRQIAVQQAQNARLDERNQALDAEVLDLRQGLASVQDLARSQLGMVKKGETFYQVIQQPSQGNKSAQQ